MKIRGPVVVAAVLAFGWVAGAQERGPREWQALECERTALEAHARRRDELAKLRSQLVAEEKALAVRTDKAIAEIVSRLGVGRAARIHFDPERGVFVEVAPVGS